MRHGNIIGDIVAAATQNIQAKNFWIDALSGQLVKSTFPFDYKKKESKEQHDMKTIPFKLNGDLFLKLMKLSNSIDYSLHMILTGLIVILLEKYTGNNDIILGAPIYKQEVQGKFINTILPIRSKIHEGMTLKDLILQLRKAFIEATENQNYPIETLVYELDIEFVENEFPLLDVIVLLENIHDKEYIRHIQPNIIFSFNRVEEAIQGVIEYNSSLYENAAIERILSHFFKVLREIIGSVETKITSIDILIEEEKNRLIFDFNNTTREYPEDKTIHGLFEEQVEKFPHSIVIVNDYTQLTYRVLNERANQLARVLKQVGVKPDSIVGIMLEKSVDMIIGILGILKAGGAYLPIDPSYPEGRRHYMLNDSNASVLLTNMCRRDEFLGNARFEVFCPDGNQDIIFQSTGNVPGSTTPNNLAYIIYTSGSTGLPKGVLIEHTSVANLKTWQSYAFGIGEGSRVMQFFSYSFDGAVGETFMAILNGASLVMLGLEKLSPGKLMEAINRHRLNLAVFVPSMIRQMDPAKLIHKDFTIVSVGEACPVDLVQKWSTRCTFVNGYGPTETTVYSHIWKAKGEEYISKYNSVPIGFPISNYKSYILDSHHNPAAVGIAGEIYISGVGVARGYLNWPEVTYERFVFNRFHLKEDKFVEKGTLMIESARQDIVEFKRQHALGNFKRNDLKTLAAGKICNDGIMKLVKNIEPDLVNKTRLLIEKYCHDPIFLGCFYRYLFEGSENSYFSCGINEELLKCLIGVGEFRGRSGIDFGIGNAEILQLFSNAGANMMGLDFNPFFIQRARDKGLNSHMLRIDANPETFKDECGIEEGTRDFAISTLVLDRIENPGNLLKNLLWVIKPGGRFAIQTLLPIVPIDDGGVEEPIVYTPVENRLAPGNNVEEDKLFLVSQLYKLGAREICVYNFSYAVCSNDGIQDYKLWSFSGIKTVCKNSALFDKYNLRSYKTGDLGCYLPDGNIKFLSRIDHQVKIRGFRIELGEIENRLLNYPGIKEAVVIPVKASGRYDGAPGESEDKETYANLCAYFVLGREINISEVRNFLSEALPNYMIPAYFVSLDSLPLSSNGKLDRKRLPLPELSTNPDGYIAPRDKLEKQLTKIWAEVLEIEKDVISINSNFFELGGHSLKVTVLINRIHKDLNVKIPVIEIFKSPSIRAVGEYIKSARLDIFTSINPAEQKEYYPLSSPQKRLYILQEMLLNSTAYNVNVIVQLEGNPVKERLENTFRELIDRHDSLRTSFFMLREKPVQKIHKNVELKIEHYDASQVEIEVIIQNFIRPFNLSQAPLLRVGLIEIKELKNILLVDMHHILTDEIAHDILINNFAALYNGGELPPLRLQYKDYTEWQCNESTRKIYKQQEEYWLKEFAGEIPVLNLPTDFSRPLIQSFEGNAIGYLIGEEETNMLNQIALSLDATLFMILLGAFIVLLSKLSGQDDIVVGTPIVVRKHVDLEQIIGMFANTIALNNSISGEQIIEEFLIEIKERTIEAFENQDYQFEDIVEKVAIERDMNRNPIFDVMFSYQNNFAVPRKPEEQEIKDLKLKPYSFEHRTSKFDLTLGVFDMGEEVNISMEYCTKLFREETIIRFIDYFKRIIRTVIDAPGKKISEIEITSEADKKQLLCDFNDTEADYPKDRTIHRLFEEQVEQTPDYIAALWPSTSAIKELHSGIHESFLQITYRELNEKSNQLSYELQTKGAGQDTVVGIMVERSVEMIIGIMGILKSGGAYLPIDPDYPQERIDYMLKDSGAKLLVTTENKEGGKVRRWEGEIYYIEELLRSSYPLTFLPSYLQSSSNPATSLAYVIYTSGTTGKPKGVSVKHQSLVNYIWWASKNYVKGENVNFPLYTSISFDLTVTSIFTPLITGNSVIIYGDHNTPIEKIEEIINDNRIEVMKLTPSHLKILKEMKPRNTCKIKRFIVGGENLESALAADIHQKFNGGIEIYNEYGPTEATVGCMIYRYTHEKEYRASVPIGVPTDNVKIYLLDKYGYLAVPGVAGEIYISGDGLSRGYLNRPELTAEKFDHDLWDYRDYHDEENKSFYGRSRGVVFSKKAPLVLYKTGDLARWLPDGNIEFLGRIDLQIKIRGFRVELGEIESLLLNHPGIKEAVVLAREEDGEDKYICAYFVSDSEYGISELRESLLKKLPDYMIPSYFVQVEKIPLTPNGKVDRRALPKPELKEGEDYIGPRDEIEKKLIDIWSDVLTQPHDKISIDDNFFELGGHSLKATILVSNIHKVFDVNVPLVEIFKMPKVRELANYIKGKSKEYYISIEPVEAKEYYPLSSAQKRLYILQQMNLDSAAYNMPEIIPLPAASYLGKIEETFKRVIKRHESLRTSFAMVIDTPVQVVHDEVEIEIEYYYLSTDYTDYTDDKKDTKNKEGQTEFFGSTLFQKGGPEAIIKSFIRPFDLSTAPLLRVGLIKPLLTPSALRGHPRRGTYNSQEGKGDKYLLLVDMHHIVSDGVSHAILVKDFLALHEGEELLPLRVQYKDFSQWQNGEKEKENLKHQEVYWLKEFAGEIPVLELPTDYPRPVEQSFEGNSINFEITGEETRGFKAMALTADSTLFMVLAAVVNILLSKLSGQEEIIIGTPIAGRRHADLEKIIGMFVNTLSLRNYPAGDRTFKEFLGEVKEKTLMAFENQEYPFEELVDKLSVKRDIGRNPLFDVMFALQNINTDLVEQDKEAEIEISRPVEADSPKEYENIFQTAKFDLTLTAMEIGRGLFLSLQYCTKLFKKETIERFIIYFKKIVSGVISNPYEKIKDIEIISLEAKNEKLNYFNENLKETFAIKPIQSRLFDVFQKYKKNIAVEYGTAKFTYAELEKRAACISRWIADYNIEKGSFIGIYIEDKIDIISAIIGILNRACIFVPLDTDLPVKRIKNMIQVVNTRVILTDAGHETVLFGMNENNHDIKHIPVINDSFYRNHEPDNNKIQDIRYDLDDKIYIYFTSGTTGIPNAIVGRNESLVQFIEWEIDSFSIDETYRFSQLAAVGFDAFLRDTFVPLFVGGTICIPCKHEVAMDSLSLIDWLDSSQINLVHCVPSVFRIINSDELTGAMFCHLKYVLLSGEPINPNELKRWYSIFNERIQLVNYYGPTETTMIKTFHLIRRSSVEAGRIPAGRPLKGARTIILDKHMKICHRGITGEIYIRTAYSTHGYLDNPELNAQRFIKNPFSRDKGNVIYKTGDLGREWENGEIEVMGRIDRQVKIRGVRIELENIENCLLKHSQIENPIVLNRDAGKGENYLCAYIVYKKQESPITGKIPTALELREFLAKELPDYMIPSYFVQVEKIPLTPNGKVDRRALPKPELKEGEDYIGPRDEIEKKLIDIWSDVLTQPHDKISIDDDFFELGGHSLKATVMVSKIHKEMGVKMELVWIFNNPTIRETASLIKNIRSATEPLNEMNTDEETVEVKL